MINGRQLRRMAMLGTAVILAPLLSPAQPAAAEPRLTLDNPTFTNAAAFDRTVAAGVPMVMDTCPAIEWRKR